MPSGFIFALLVFLSADLRQAVRSGDIASTEVILSSGFNHNTRDAMGATALHDAVWSGHADLVRLLLDHGADVTAKDAKGHSERIAREIPKFKKIIDDAKIEKL